MSYSDLITSFEITMTKDKNQNIIFKYYHDSEIISITESPLTLINQVICFNSTVKGNIFQVNFRRIWFWLQDFNFEQEAPNPPKNGYNIQKTAREGASFCGKIHIRISMSLYCMGLVTGSLNGGNLRSNFFFSLLSLTYSDGSPFPAAGHLRKTPSFSITFTYLWKLRLTHLLKV